MSKIDPNSPWAMFATDEQAEQAGIDIEYGPFYFKVRRAGGSNTRFRDRVRERMRPHRRAIQTETMNEELAKKIAREVFAETVVITWGSEKFGEGKIAGPDGKPIEFSVEACQDLFKSLPELAADVMEQASQFNNFRAAIAEVDAGN